jgi:hypothetical protein
VGDAHNVRRVKELDNRLDGQIGVGRWQSEEYHGLSCCELLPLGVPGERSLDARAKYGMAAMPSRSLAAAGGDEEDVGVGSGDEGTGRWQARL